MTIEEIWLQVLAYLFIEICKMEIIRRKCKFFSLYGHYLVLKTLRDYCLCSNDLIPH